MTVFDTAIDVLFTDPNLSIPVTYTPIAGGPVDVQAIKTSTEDRTGLFDGGHVVRKQKLNIRVSDVATVAAGDSVTIGVDWYTVANPQIKDDNQLIWSMELIE
jgi:hypothetical protein